MRKMQLIVGALVAAVAISFGSTGLAQTSGEKERFNAVAIVNNNLGSGAGTVQIQVTRWSTEAERNKLVSTLLDKGQDKLLDVLQDMKSVGTIKTPDSLGYDLRYAHETRTEEGGRRIVLATDRPIGFWEAANNRRTLDYPFTIVQMEFDREGKGKGTLSAATKVIADKKTNTIVLENFATRPVMLSQITAEKTR